MDGERKGTEKDEKYPNTIRGKWTEKGKGRRGKRDGEKEGIDEKKIQTEMDENKKWHWKTSKAWYGIGIYHVTLVVPSREPLLGKLVIPENDAKQALVERTELGERITEEALRINRYYPEIRVIQHCLMPDHLHIIYYVTAPMEASIKSVIRGLWQGVKKIGRAYTENNKTFFNSELNSEETDGEKMPTTGIKETGREKMPTTGIKETDGEKMPATGIKETDGEKMPTTGVEETGRVYANPIFTEVPFIRPMSRRGQLQAMIHYVQMNPQRLATKRLLPGYFRVQQDVEINGRRYDAVGNIKILQAESFSPVHVRRIWVEDAERHGDDSKLRGYKNGCISAARQGTVMVSPFISPHEKAVLDYLLREGHSVIYIADNGLGEYYKPCAGLFEAVAEGRMLILSPWQHEPEKKHVTREECAMMNQMAEEICNA